MEWQPAFPLPLHEARRSAHCIEVVDSQNHVDRERMVVPPEIFVRLSSHLMGCPISFGRFPSAHLCPSSGFGHNVELFHHLAELDGSLNGLEVASPHLAMRFCGRLVARRPLHGCLWQ